LSKNQKGENSRKRIKAKAKIIVPFQQFFSFAEKKSSFKRSAEFSRPIYFSRALNKQKNWAKVNATFFSVVIKFYWYPASIITYYRKSNLTFNGFLFLDRHKKTKLEEKEIERSKSRR
jgi:hypothetical protein